MSTSSPLRLSVVPKEKEFRLYRASDFPDLPEMRWLVEDITAWNRTQVFEWLKQQEGK